jgi:hypothetical protein
MKIEFIPAASVRSCYINSSNQCFHQNESCLGTPHTTKVETYYYIEKFSPVQVKGAKISKAQDVLIILAMDATSLSIFGLNHCSGLLNV